MNLARKLLLGGLLGAAVMLLNPLEAQAQWRYDGYRGGWSQYQRPYNRGYRYAPNRGYYYGPRYYGGDYYRYAPPAYRYRSPYRYYGRYYVPRGSARLGPLRFYW